MAEKIKPQEDGKEQPSEEVTQENKGTGTKKKGLKDARIEVKVGLIAAVVIVLFGILFGTHVLCIHQWSNATCTEPSTCALCGATRGKAHGHKMLRATCTEPSTCGLCGYTEGKPKGHKWEDAPCTSPKTCAICGETQGTALGHDLGEWTVTKEASCVEAGMKKATCKRCNKDVEEEIEKLDHVPGDWQVTVESTVTSTGSVLPGKREIKCTACGTTLQSEEYSITVSTSQRNALGTAASYLRMGGFSHQRLIEQLEFEGYSNEDATFAADHCGADWMDQAEMSAKSYMRFMNFSRAGLISQLQFEGFTAEQAAHGADSVGL